MLLFAFALSAQTYPGDCVYYNRHGDRISVNAKILPTGLDTNFLKAHVLFEDVEDTTYYRTYSIIELEPWALRKSARKYMVKGMNVAKYKYYFMRIIGSAKPKRKEMDLYEAMGSIGGKGCLLIVNKKTLQVEVKFLYLEV